MVENAAGCSTGNDGTHRPENIVECGHSTTVRWMRDFDDIARTCRGHKLDTQSHEEAATHKLVNAVGANASPLDNNSNDDDSSSDEHAKFSSPVLQISIMKP
jgi:hypothetical protein